MNAAEHICDCFISVQENNHHNEQKKKKKRHQNAVRLHNNNINITFVSLLAKVIRSLFELRVMFLQASTLSLIFILSMVLLHCPA